MQSLIQFKHQSSDVCEEGFAKLNRNMNESAASKFNAKVYAGLSDQFDSFSTWTWQLWYTWINLIVLPLNISVSAINILISAWGSNSSLELFWLNWLHVSWSAGEPLHLCLCRMSKVTTDQNNARPIPLHSRPRTSCAIEFCSRGPCIISLHSTNFLCRSLKFLSQCLYDSLPIFHLFFYFKEKEPQGSNILWPSIICMI